MFNGIKITISINHKQAMFKFKELGLDLYSLFDENSDTMLTIMAKDRVMLHILYDYVQPHCGSFEKALDYIDTELLSNFREVFWQEVVNFSPYPMRGSLEQMWVEAKKQLSSPEKISKNTSSAGSEE
jgi:hypothetical protein